MRVDEFKNTLLRRSQETAKKARVAKPKPPVAEKILNVVRELLIVVIGVLIACALLLIMAGGAMEIGEWVRTL